VTLAPYPAGGTAWSESRIDRPETAADEQVQGIDACANMIVDHTISIDQENIITVE
jgi:hypothetical protein